MNYGRYNLKKQFFILFSYFTLSATKPGQVGQFIKINLILRGLILLIKILSLTFCLD